jgi:hypothetical protein
MIEKILSLQWSVESVSPVITVIKKDPLFYGGCVQKISALSSSFVGFSLSNELLMAACDGWHSRCCRISGGSKSVSTLRKVCTILIVCRAARYRLERRVALNQRVRVDRSGVWNSRCLVKESSKHSGKTTSSLSETPIFLVTYGADETGLRLAQLAKYCVARNSRVAIIFLIVEFI